jgi:hypothetical protein
VGERKKDSVERARVRDCEFACVLFDIFQLFGYQLFCKDGNGDLELCCSSWSFVCPTGATAEMSGSNTSTGDTRRQS